jgi:hypothetical protein
LEFGVRQGRLIDRVDPSQDDRLGAEIT